MTKNERSLLLIVATSLLGYLAEQGVQELKTLSDAIKAVQKEKTIDDKRNTLECKQRIAM